MRLPITTTGMTLIAGSLEPVIDFETEKQRADQNGELPYTIDVVTMAPRPGRCAWPGSRRASPPASLSWSTI